MLENLLKKAKRKIDLTLDNDPDSEMVTINLSPYLQSIEDNFDPRSIRRKERLESLGIPNKYVNKVPMIGTNILIFETPISVRECWKNLITISNDNIKGFLKELKEYIRSKGLEVESTTIGTHGSEYALVIRRPMQEKYKRLFRSLRKP